MHTGPFAQGPVNNLLCINEVPLPATPNVQPMYLAGVAVGTHQE